MLTISDGAASYTAAIIEKWQKIFRPKADIFKKFLYKIIFKGGIFNLDTLTPKRNIKNIQNPKFNLSKFDFFLLLTFTFLVNSVCMV